jgi:hypothetical protein
LEIVQAVADGRDAVALCTFVIQELAGAHKLCAAGLIHRKPVSVAESASVARTQSCRDRCGVHTWRKTGALLLLLILIGYILLIRKIQLLQSELDLVEHIRVHPISLQTRAQLTRGAPPVVA